METVDLKDAKYIIFVDWIYNEPLGYETLEDAEEAMRDLESLGGFQGKFTHYLVEVKSSREVKHER